MTMDLDKELGGQKKKEVDNDSETDEDPDELMNKNMMLDKELYNKKKSMGDDDEDIPELKSSKPKRKNKRKHDETDSEMNKSKISSEEGFMIDDGKMKEVDKDKFKRKGHDNPNELLMMDGNLKEGNKDKFKRKREQ